MSQCAVIGIAVWLVVVVLSLAMFAIEVRRVPLIEELPEERRNE